MLDDIPATLAQIARHLGIKESTLKKYRKTGNAPIAVLLSLFWETRWGQSAADCDAHNAMVTARAHARSLQDHQARLAGIIWRLEMELTLEPSQRAANLPIWRFG